MMKISNEKIHRIHFSDYVWMDRKRERDSPSSFTVAHHSPSIQTNYHYYQQFYFIESIIYYHVNVCV